MRTWEYKTISSRGDHAGLAALYLNELGKQGWELVCVAMVVGEARFPAIGYFKREVIKT